MPAVNMLFARRHALKRFLYSQRRHKVLLSQEKSVKTYPEAGLSGVSSMITARRTENASPPEKTR
jgi:hypothetical protein